MFCVCVCGIANATSFLIFHGIRQAAGGEYMTEQLVLFFFES